MPRDGPHGRAECEPQSHGRLPPPPRAGPHLKRGTSALWISTDMAGLVTLLVRCRMRSDLRGRQAGTAAQSDAAGRRVGRAGGGRPAAPGWCSRSAATWAPAGLHAWAARWLPSRWQAGAGAGAGSQPGLCKKAGSAAGAG